MTVQAAWPHASPSAIALGRRPGFLGLAFVVRSVFAALAALIVASSVGASGLTQFPSGDALLFEDGGLYLLEVLRAAGPHLLASVRSGGAVLALGAAVNLLVLATLLVALGSGGRLGVGAVLGRAIGFVPAFFLLGSLVLLAQSLVLLGASMGGALVQASGLGERSADLFALGIGLLSATLAVALGSLLDVARAAVARYELRAKQALLFALDAARATPLSVLFGWLPFAVAGSVLVLAGAFCVQRVDVSVPQTWRVVLVFAIHQATLLALLLLRAAWLTRALRLVARHVPGRNFAL